MTVTIDDIRAAAAAIADSLVTTPSAPSAILSEMTGAEVVLKFESLHYTASFKERGALVKLKGLNAADAARGVIAMSAGNHAQGVAYHARHLGIPVSVVMPRTTAFTKIRATERLGARVVLEGETITAAAQHAMQLAEKEKLTFVHPFDDDEIIAGQSTIALELLAAHPDLEALVIPVGGGGLIAGNAIAAKAIKPGIEVIGVEAQCYPGLNNALKGDNLPVGGQTIAEGIAVERIGERPLAIARELVDDVILIGEAHLEAAVNLLLSAEKTVAEGAGAAPLAALFAAPARFEGKRVGVVLSGGNIDARLLASVIMRGLVRDGRMVSIRVEISDMPGMLARVAEIVGSCGGNIIEVNHQRLFSDVPLKSADLDLVVETRDSRHVDRIMDQLADAGFPARLLSSMASAS